MLLMTNDEPQTVAVGQAVQLDEVLFQSRKGCECHRRNLGAAQIKCSGIYEIQFSANIGGAAAGAVALAIQAGGVTLPETTMISTSAAANQLNNVATSTVIRVCCAENSRVSIVNVGNVGMTVANPKLLIKRVG